MMEKTARKPSADPTQERLRQNKAAWNKDVSAFINDLIHLKKTMNGWPSKFFKERSKIIQPIPADPTTILGALAGDFQELAQRGNTIVQEQLDYSKSRRQTQPKAPATPEVGTPAQPTAAPPPAPGAPTAADLTKQLAASFESKYGLVAEASNPFSRFVARMRTPQMGFGASAQVRRLRMDMLKAALRSYKTLGKLQVEITKSSKESIQNAHKLMQFSWNEWSIVSKNFVNYVNSLPEQVATLPDDMKEDVFNPGKEEPDLTPPAAKPVITPPAKVVAPPRTAPLSPEPTPSVEEPSDPLVEEPVPFRPSPPPLKLLSKHPPLKGSTPAKAAAHSQEQLEVVAQAFLKKWLGKTRHQVLPGRSSGVRLQIYELAAKARKNINGVMDLLEKGLPPEELKPRISEVVYQMNTLRSLMRSLAFTERPQKGQDNSPMMGMF